MKLYLTLVLAINILFANETSSFKLKTEENRALILQQNTVAEFYLFIGNPWFEDEKFSRELLEKYIYAVKLIKNQKVLNNKDIFRNMPASIYGYTGENIRSDKDILLSFSKKDFSDYQLFQNASQSLKKDKNFVNILLDRGENIYPYIDTSLKSDEVIVEKSMKISILNYPLLPKKYRKNKQMTMRAVKKFSYLLKHADESLKDDIDVIYTSLRSIEYASSRLKDNKQLMWKVIKEYGSAIEYASDRLKDNKEFMLKVISKYGSAIKYASSRLKKDKEIITLSVLEAYYNFEYADSTLKKDEAYVKMLIEKDGNVLKYADKSLQRNPALVNLALDNGLRTLTFTTKEIQKNRIFALKALSNGGHVSGADQSLHEDYIYMTEAIKRNPNNIKYVQNKLKDDIGLAEMAIEQDIQLYFYLSENMQNNSRIKALLPKNTHKQASFLKPSFYQRKGAIRGVTISFLIVSKDPNLVYQLLSPPQGMKIVKKLVGNSCFTPSLGKGGSGVVVEWNVPMDIEEKTYDITMRGIDKKGNIEAITFPARVPKTKPIQSKLENNELTVIDKTSPLYGMKMKGHSGEDISNLKIRAVEYEDVWKKRVKKKSHKDVKEHIVFVADNIPKALDVKMPEWMDSYNERINIGMHSYTYKREILVGQFWERGIGEHYLYDKTDAYVYLNKDNHSEIFLIVLEKAQNRNKQ